LLEIVQTEKPSRCLGPRWLGRYGSRLQTYLQDGPAPLLRIGARKLLGVLRDHVRCSLEAGYDAVGIGVAVAVVDTAESFETVERFVPGAE